MKTIPALLNDRYFLQSRSVIKKERGDDIDSIHSGCLNIRNMKKK